MEWNSKLPSWGFAELEQNAELINMGTFVRSSSGQGSPSSGMDCSVDLKLGGLDGFRPPEKWKSRPTTSTVAVSSVRSKRARALGNASQTASCSVDGCTSDLSHSREYHRRHKVCELHSKTPIVMVGGQEQRFCQQCSRFHLLMEFDEEKRSCRKRLDGHNRRRRKPQPDSINPGSLYPYHKDSRFSAYPHALPTPLHELNWAGIIHTENTLYTNRLPLQVLDNQQNFSGSFCSCKKEKQFSFLQDDTAAFGITTGQSTFQPLKNVSSAESSSCSSKNFSNGILQVHSDCALSLLSSPTQNPGIAMDQVLPAGRFPLHQSLVSSILYDNLGIYADSQASSFVSPARFSCSGAKDEELGTVFVCNSETDLHCQSLFHVGEGPSDGIPQCHPLSWHFGSNPC